MSVDGRRRWLILAVIALAQLMVVLDGTIVNIALPSAQADLHFSNGDRQWVITAYALAFGSLLLLGGRLADMFGRRRLFLAGLAGFALASAAGGAAGSIGALLAARALQGVFAAMLAPAALSLLTTTFRSGPDRARAFGIFGAVAGSGAALGLLLGGVLTEAFSWRYCLFVNLVFAAVAVSAGAVLLEPDRGRRARLDVAGVLTVTAGLFCVVFGFAHAESAGWGDALTLIWLAAGAVLLAAFVALQARSSNPLLPLRVLADRDRAGAYLATAVVGAAMFGAFLFITYYMQVVLRYSAINAGLAFLPMCAAIVGASSTGSALLTTRVSAKVMLPTGMAVAGLGMLLFTGIAVGGNYAHHVLPASLVLGLGLGTVFGFASNTATRRVEPTDAGVASAMVNVGQQVGASVGTALLNTVAAAATARYAGSHAASLAGHAAAEVTGYRAGFAAAAVLLAAGAVVTALSLRRGVPAEPQRYAPAEPTVSVPGGLHPVTTRPAAD